jgi:predicted nucleic acid-binding protein
VVEEPRGVLVDASFLVAFHNERDVHHQRAVRGMEELLAGHWGGALLLEYIFLEVVTVLLVRRGLETAREVADILAHAAELEFVPCSDLFASALDIFRRQSGSRLSFADAALVAAARQRGISHLATFDEGLREIGGLTLVPR